MQTPTEQLARVADLAMTARMRGDGKGTNEAELAETLEIGIALLGGFLENIGRIAKALERANETKR